MILPVIFWLVDIRLYKSVLRSQLEEIPNYVYIQQVELVSIDWLIYEIWTLPLHTASGYILGGM